MAKTPWAPKGDPGGKTPRRFLGGAPIASVRRLGDLEIRRFPPAGAGVVRGRQQPSRWNKLIYTHHVLLPVPSFSQLVRRSEDHAGIPSESGSAEQTVAAASTDQRATSAHWFTR